ncbi:unnamed protein product [Penicillium salamii]|uniref:Uncharacterized protein n=1 Tax=Penicillium salamii TaxID=1612424 RepID=A0A9W4IEW3_9EURO|nr:unnamed protein product [Penicillium salamii]
MSAGAEHSCQIDATEMDAATLKLMALADVVQNSMERSSLGTRWSPEAQSLPEDPNRLSIDELMRSKQLGSSGELNMLVNVVTKDACHEIHFLGCG